MRFHGWMQNEQIAFIALLGERAGSGVFPNMLGRNVAIKSIA